MRRTVKWWLAMVVVTLGVGWMGLNDGAQRHADSAEATESDAAAEIAKLRTELEAYSSPRGRFDLDALRGLH